MSHKPTVVIYRNHLLRHSETFIREQVSNLKQFDYQYAGSRSVAGLALPDDKVSTVYGPKLSKKIGELIFKTSGIAPEMYRRLRSFNPALMHAHFGPDAVRVIPLSQKLGIPLIVTFHGYDATVKPSYAWRSSYTQFVYLMRKRRLQKEAAHFIAVSDFIKGLLIEQGFPSKKISTHYIGIDTDKFSPNCRIKRSPTVLFVGRLVEVKGCEFLIEAMAIVQSLLPKAELIVLGDGPLKSQLEEHALKKLKKVRFLGFQSPSVVRDWMNKAKVFCVPSITAKSGHVEAFGTVFTEAQSMGLPVVTFHSGGISEAVEHGKTGFLVPEKNTRELSARILQILENSEIWDEFSYQGMKRAREKFDIVRQTMKLESLYSSFMTS